VTIIFFCYLLAGVLTALVSLILVPVAKKVFRARIVSTKKLPLALALILNSITSIVVLVKESTVPMLGTGLWSVRIMLGIVGILLVFFLVAVVVPRLTKRLFFSALSACVACELFWCFVRGSFLKGGMFGKLTQGLHVSIVFIVACMLCCVVFILLYWLVPKLTSRVGFYLVAAVFFVCLTMWNPRISAARSEDSGKQANIVLIILDTLRADHLSCYGYSKKTTPNIDRFASESVKYTRAYSNASWTLPSVASIMTGKYPGSHGAHRNKNKDWNCSAFNILADRQRTLAEILHDNGYATAGITSCQFVTEYYGMHQGFEYFDDAMPTTLIIMPTFGLLPFLNCFFPVNDYLGSRGLTDNRVASQINTSARAWLQNNAARGPFFLLLHYFDVHHPYYPEKIGTAASSIPPAIMKKYGGNSVNYAEVEWRLLASVQTGAKPLLEHEREYLVSNYDREIMALDQKVGSILEVIKKRGLYDDSLIIITSDHGEAFGEHNLVLHGMCLYENNLHVPLLVKYPLGGAPAGTREYPVSLIDIVPTVLSYLSIPVPDDVQGTSLDNPKEQTILSQNYWNPRSKWQEPLRSDTVSLLRGDYQYIRFLQTQDQFFNLQEDSGESNNIIESEAAQAKTLLQKLNSHINLFSLFKAEDTGVKAEMDETTLENLKALGYIN